MSKKNIWFCFWWDLATRFLCHILRLFQSIYFFFSWFYFSFKKICVYFCFLQHTTFSCFLFSLSVDIKWAILHPEACMSLLQPNVYRRGKGGAHKEIQRERKVRWITIVLINKIHTCYRHDMFQKNLWLLWAKVKMKTALMIIKKGRLFIWRWSQ